MARRKPRTRTRTILFNVEYEDGTLSSNRKITSDRLESSFGEDPQDLARVAIEEQDRIVAERSGQHRGKIKTITRIR